MKKVIRIERLATAAAIKQNVNFKKRGEIDNHLDNLKLILRYSNATPIRRRRNIGYVCNYCNDEFIEASDLKQHTLEAHDDSKSEFFKSQEMRTFLVKLDITSLHCRICNDNISVLDELIDHLSNKHDKKFHSDLKNHIVPFKFDDNVFRCVVCSNEFNNFKLIQEHMNTHYRNHVCEICGCGFVNLRMLQNHSYRHNTGVFKCSHCEKKFDSRIKQKQHERTVHVYLNKRYKCGYCGEKFADYTKKHDHEVKTHGVRKLVLTCQACEKIFDNQKALTVHTRSYHMMVKRTKSKLPTM